MLLIVALFHNLDQGLCHNQVSTYFLGNKVHFRKYGDPKPSISFISIGLEAIICVLFMTMNQIFLMPKDI